MSGASATEYPPHVAALMSASRSPQTFPETLRPEPTVDEDDAAEREGGREPEPAAEPLHPDEPGDQRREDRQRPEQERDSRRSRQVEREDEAELVQEQEHDRAADEQQVPPLDPQGALDAAARWPGRSARRSHSEFPNR